MWKYGFWLALLWISLMCFPHVKSSEIYTPNSFDVATRSTSSLSMRKFGMLSIRDLIWLSTLALCRICRYLIIMWPLVLLATSCIFLELVWWCTSCSVVLSMYLTIGHMHGISSTIKGRNCNIYPLYPGCWIFCRIKNYRDKKPKKNIIH